MNLAGIAALDKDQVRTVLENHELFEPDEIRLAAKMKVEFDKRTMKQIEWEARRYDRDLRMLNEYNRQMFGTIYAPPQRSLWEELTGGRLF